MDSTNHNLENPTKIDTLRVVKDVLSWDFPTVKRVTQEFYDLGQKHDPHVIYSIINSPDMRVYYGDHLVLKPINRGEKYFLTILDDGTYSVSLNQVSNHHDNLIEICRFDDPQKAIEVLTLFNEIGDHQHRQFHLMNMINAYCNMDITCHDLIIGIISEYGYKNDPRLQEVFMVGGLGGNAVGGVDISDTLLKYIQRMGSVSPTNPLYRKYLDVYDIIVENGFMKMDGHMKDVIHSISNIFN